MQLQPGVASRTGKLHHGHPTFSVIHRSVSSALQPKATCIPGDFGLSHVQPNSASLGTRWLTNQLDKFECCKLRRYATPHVDSSLACRQAGRTGQDSFLLGPSGYGFLHPSIIPDSDPLLPQYVNATLEALRNLSMSAYVHWDEYDNQLPGLVNGSTFGQQQVRRSSPAWLASLRSSKEMHQIRSHQIKSNHLY